MDLIYLFVLAIWSFFEAIFFPIPVDLIILFLVKEGENPYLVALIATIFNTLGSIIGYKIGKIINEKRKNKNSKLNKWIKKIMNFFIDIKGSKRLLLFFKKYEELSNNYIKNYMKKYDLEKNDIVVFFYFLSTISPLPQKIFAIISGYFSINLFIFIVLTILGRGFRFLIVAIAAEVLTTAQLIAIVVILLFIYLFVHYYLKKKLKLNI
jgi:membrane protein YqaA with SNARE-associated domain